MEGGGLSLRHGNEDIADVSQERKMNNEENGEGSERDSHYFVFQNDCKRNPVYVKKENRSYSFIRGYYVMTRWTHMHLLSSCQRLCLCVTSAFLLPTH